MVSHALMAICRVVYVICVCTYTSRQDIGHYYIAHARAIATKSKMVN